MLTAVQPIGGVTADTPDTTGRSAVLVRRLANLQKELTDTVRDTGGSNSAALLVHAVSQQMASVQVQIAQLQASQRADQARYSEQARATSAQTAGEPGSDPAGSAAADLAAAATRQDLVTHPDPSTPARQAQVWADETQPAAVLGAVVNTQA